MNVSGARPGRVLFHDAFEADRIDPTLWRWDQRDYSYQGMGSHNHAQISQRNGSVLLTSMAKSDNGWSSARAVWLDSLSDLKVGEDVTVEVAYVVTGQRGKARVLVTHPGQDQPIAHMPDWLLLEHKADEHHTLDDSACTRSLYFHAASNSVLVTNSLSGPAAEYRLIDLSGLEHWRLRFLAASETSSGFADGEMHLRLDDVRAHVAPPATLVYGQVFDTDRGEPVSDVIVTGPEGQTCRVDARGMYLLPILPEQHELLQIADARFDVVKETPVAYARLGQQVRLDIHVRRTPPRYGDAVQTLKLPQHNVLSAVHAGPDGLALVAGGGNVSALYTINEEGTPIGESSRFPDVTGLARLEGVTYGVSHWPGRLYCFREGSTSPQVFELETLWPRGLGYDGEYLWTLNADQQANRFEVWALDPETGSVAHRFSTADSGVRSITCGQGRLWVGSLSGVVYEVDPQLAVESGSLERAVVDQFNGIYECLSYSETNRELWAIDARGEALVRIHVRKEP